MPPMIQSERILRAALLVAAFLASAALWWPAPAQAARLRKSPRCRACG